MSHQDPRPQLRRAGSPVSLSIPTDGWPLLDGATYEMLARIPASSRAGPRLNFSATNVMFCATFGGLSSAVLITAAGVVQEKMKNATSSVQLRVSFPAKAKIRRRKARSSATFAWELQAIGAEKLFPAAQEGESPQRARAGPKRSSCQTAFAAPLRIRYTQDLCKTIFFS